MQEALFKPVKPDENNDSVDEDWVRNEGNDVQDDLTYKKSATRILEWCGIEGASLLVSCYIIDIDT